MHRRLPLIILSLAAFGLPGCSSARRPIAWWRNGSVPAHVGQRDTSIADESDFETLSAAPPKLPPGIELPPEKSRPAEKQPSAASQPAQNEAKESVIFAGFRN